MNNQFDRIVELKKQHRWKNYIYQQLLREWYDITMDDVYNSLLQIRENTKEERYWIDAEYKKEYYNRLINKTNNEYRKFKVNAYSASIFQQEMDKSIENWKAIPLNKVKPVWENKERIFVFSDIHIGKQWTDEIINRIDEFADNICNCKEKNVSIIFLWDLAECFLPRGNEMHKWQMDNADILSTSELYLTIVNILENMLLKIYNQWKIITFYWILWNHDRVTEKEENDRYREWWLTVYKFLKKWLSKYPIEIVILPWIDNTILYEWIKIVTLHWYKIDQTQLQRRAVEDKDEFRYLVYLTGDKHFLKTTNISKSVMRIQSPALSWAWDYDKSLWLSSLPWYVEIVSNTHWTIDFTVKFL